MTLSGVEWARVSVKCKWLESKCSILQTRVHCHISITCIFISDQFLAEYLQSVNDLAFYTLLSGDHSGKTLIIY